MKQTISLISIVFVLGGILTLNYSNATKTENVKNCKIVDLQQQQIISGSKDRVSTEIRYLIITDKETFICKSSFYNSKYDNSNIFFHLQKGKVYNFKVSGYGKSFLFDYRNILEIKNIKIN